MRRVDLRQSTDDLIRVPVQHDSLGGLWDHVFPFSHSINDGRRERGGETAPPALSLCLNNVQIQ